MDGGPDGCGDGPDFDCDGLGSIGVDYDGDGGFDTSSFAFDCGDVDTTGAEVLGESGGDLSSADYSVGDSEDGNPLGCRTQVSLEQPAKLAVHVVGHGEFDVCDQLHEIATSQSLVRIPWIRVGGRDIDQVHGKLLPLSTWDNQVPKGKMSAGWYEGATGSTTVFRRYYCVGVWGNFFLPILSKLVYDRETRVFIEVTGITWRFEETGDYETHLILKVHFLPEYELSSNRWFTPDHLVSHNRKAQLVRDKFFRAIRFAFPKESSVDARENVEDGISPCGEASPDVAQVGFNLEQYGQGAVMIPA